MIKQHGEDRSLYSWLVMQEKILKMWIDEALATAPRETDFIAKLEHHHDWLAAQIENLSGKKAA
ncbi:hypothetical protein PUV54_03215 [Hyphococcus flavus]|uniref:Uncharacterized protein n=1 Tax=Hyphococcus flavus TaxID=1866326 RepID=A0AAF0CF60_9PROT|nr:hypothetical protein [Hyphococcus flavus]WDI32201.1 hypothetical protein PUV54_03215 [Hyphococcus flavus]